MYLDLTKEHDILVFHYVCYLQTIYAGYLIHCFVISNYKTWAKSSYNLVKVH